MKKILVAVDFSPASRHAAEFAALLAKTTGAEVQLLHVYKDIIPATVGLEPWTVAVSDLRKLNEKHIEEETMFLASKYGIQVTGSLQNGLKVNAIRRIAKEVHADLIVLGLKEQQSKTGSIIAKMIRRTQKPVLFVPEKTQWAGFRNIVLAVDFMESPGASCFAPLFDILESFDALLKVIHVENKGADLKMEEMPAKLELGRILGKVSYFYDKLENDNAENGILRFVQEHPTDLLVMVAHPHSLVLQPFGTDHIYTIIQQANMPLLVLKEM